MSLHVYFMGYEQFEYTFCMTVTFPRTYGPESDVDEDGKKRKRVINIEVGDDHIK